MCDVTETLKKEGEKTRRHTEQHQALIIEWIGQVKLENEETKQDIKAISREVKENREIGEKLIADMKEDIKKNSAKIKELNIKTNTLIEIATPIAEGIHAIQESVKVLSWISKAMKWITSVVIGIAGSVYAWTEYLQHIFDRGH